MNLHNIQKLSDVTVLSSIQKKLQNLVNECSSDLDRYSRYIGKNDRLDDLKKSLAFLPAELVASLKEESIGEIQHLLLDKESIVIPVGNVLKKILEEEKPTKESLHSLTRILEMKNIGMEPDVLAYPYDLSPNDQILLFPLSMSIPKDRTDGNYLLNVMVVELAEAVARADGSVDEKESEAIGHLIHSFKGISDYQAFRLHKHQKFLRHASVQESSIKKKLKAIPSSDVAKLLASVNHVVLADGVIDSSEIQFLERIYKYLDIDTSELYHHIQNPNEFGRMRSDDTVETIDFDRVKSLKEESAEVSDILSEIFSDSEAEVTGDNEESDVLPVPLENDNRQCNPLGLDDSQMVFLTHLLSQPLWKREELQRLADELKIMLDGTLELINESALDQYNLPVTEGDDEMEILEEFWGKTEW